MSIGCEVRVDGRRLADGSAGDPDTDPTVLSGLSVTWGRGTTIDQAEPATCTLTVLDTSGDRAFLALLAVNRRLRVTAPDTDSQATPVVVFDGPITDIDAAYDDAQGAIVCTATAVDLAGELAQVKIGDQPWPAETLGDRANRIVGLAGAAIGRPILASIPPTSAGLPVGRRDIDRRPVTDLLTDLAVTADSALSAGHLLDTMLAEIVRLDDPAARVPLYQLAKPGPLVVIVPTTQNGIELPAALVDLPPVTWRQDTADVLTRITVVWRDQTTSPDPTERDYTIGDDSAAARDLTVTTDLTTEAAAAALATRLLTRLTDTAWRLPGAFWPLDRDLDADQAAAAVQLLDGTRRAGAAIRLTGLPGWCPTPGDLPVYLEGGRCTYTAAAWTLDLSLSSASGVGAAAAWNQLDPAWTWNDLDPDLSWARLIGVAGPQT